MWALVPLKLLAQAKQRLAPKLSPEQRQQLVLAMAADVLNALGKSRCIEHVLLISRNTEAQALASQSNAELFAESTGADLPMALVEGIAHASKHKASGVCIVPADTPLLSSQDLDHLISEHRGCTIVPDSQRGGTNALVLSPPDNMEPIFDGHSFTPHLRAAIALGLSVRVVSTPRFSLDIDTPDDLQRLLASAIPTQAGAYLRRVTDP